MDGPGRSRFPFQPSRSFRNRDGSDRDVFAMIDIFPTWITDVLSMAIRTRAWPLRVLRRASLEVHLVRSRERVPDP